MESKHKMDRIVLSHSNNNKFENLKSELLVLIEAWDEQTKEFRRLSLVSNDPIEVARMRAKADTLNYRRGELIVALEWAEDKEHDDLNSHSRDTEAL